MEVLTSRFGTLAVQSEDEILFEKGLIGFEDCRRWVLLTDSENSSLGWLQSLQQGHIALGIVSPRKFVADYRLRVNRADLQTLELATIRDAEVVVIASRHQWGITLNLRAPLVINVERRLGCQVISNDELPVQYSLPVQQVEMRKIA